MLSLEKDEARLRLEDITRYLGVMRENFGAAARPIPEALWDNRVFEDLSTGIYAINEENSTRFPLELTGVARSRDLRAYFNCYPFLGSSRPVTVRMEMDQVAQISAHLRNSLRTPVSEWNLLQLNAAESFAALASAPRRGIAYKLIEVFQQGDPLAFNAALAKYQPAMA